MVATGAAAAAVALGQARPASALAAVEVAPGLQIVPRGEWGGDLAPRGALANETPEDVRFLLVHHSVTPNTYGPGETVGHLRSFYGLHTGPEKGWADVAYNFFVDRHGQVFEGRTGSLHDPVKGDATGGSQGFALLCCFVGDHRTEPPSLAATGAMTMLLAWLADEYGIDTDPGATAEFTSRGSNRHPAGTTVRTATIAGHRDMSATECPGDAGYALVTQELPAAVTGRRREVAQATTTTAVPPPPPTTTEPVPAAAGAVARRQPAPSRGSFTDALPMSVAVGGLVAAGSAALLLRDRRRSQPAGEAEPEGGTGEDPPAGDPRFAPFG